ncbi:MAG: hypothetical protein SWK76_02305 [Actinomycetota bacterium]|nr:hypothetical protein [Actinomycetota bacterium]
MMSKSSLRTASLLVYAMLGLSLLVSACGGSGGEGLLKRELPENATPEKILLDGLNATDEARTLNYLFDYALVIPPSAEQAYTSEFRFEGEGDYSAETGNAQAHMVWPAFEQEFDYKLYDGKQYYRMEEGGVWYELPEGSSFNVPSVSDITRNTSEYMDNFQKITRLEDESVNDKDCYHIAMVPNFDAIMENEQFLDMFEGEEGEMEEGRLQEIEDLKTKLKDANVNYEYWLDKEYLVLRRTLYNFEYVDPGDDETSPHTVKLIMEIDFPAYNQDVKVDPPESTMLHKETSS